MSTYTKRSQFLSYCIQLIVAQTRSFTSPDQSVNNSTASLSRFSLKTKRYLQWKQSHKLKKVSPQSFIEFCDLHTLISHEIEPVRPDSIPVHFSICNIFHRQHMRIRHTIMCISPLAVSVITPSESSFTRVSLDHISTTSCNRDIQVMVFSNSLLAMPVQALMKGIFHNCIPFIKELT